jgi:hypothetical protein
MDYSPMLNAVRHNIVGDPTQTIASLLSDFGMFMTVLGATELAAYASDPDILEGLETEHPVSRIVAASNFGAWFPEGTDLSKDIEVTMPCIKEYNWSQHPTNVDDFGNPIRVKGTLKRQLFDIIIAGSPTFSLDMDLMTKMLENSVKSLGLLQDVQTIKDGVREAAGFPSGWVLITDPVQTPNMLYGVET